MQPKTEKYEVFSIVKSSWKSKKLNKYLFLEPNGIITVQGFTEESKEQFKLYDVQQIIWSD